MKDFEKKDIEKDNATNAIQNKSNNKFHEPTMEEIKEITNIKTTIKDESTKKEWNKKGGSKSLGLFLKILLSTFFFTILFGVGFLLSTILGENLKKDKEVQIILEAPEQVPVGSILDWKVLIVNNENIRLKDLKLEIRFDEKVLENIGFSESYNAKRANLLEWRISEIQKNERKEIKISSNIKSFDKGETSLDVKLFYKIDGSSDEFKTSVSKTIKISEPLISCNISSTPLLVSNGEELEIEISSVNNESEILDNLTYTLITPNGFIADESSFPDNFTTKKHVEKENSKSSKNTGNNETDTDNKDKTDDFIEDTNEKTIYNWTVKNFKPNEKKNFNVKGSIVGEDLEEKTFTIEIGKEIEKNYKLYCKKSTKVKVSKSVLSVNLLVNDKEDIVIASPGEKLKFKLIAKNFGSERSKTLTLSMDFPDYLNLGTLIAPQAEAIVGRTVNFTSRGVPKLSSLKAGEEVEIEFEINVASGVAYLIKKGEKGIEFDLYSTLKEGLSSDSNKTESKKVKVLLNSELKLIQNKVLYFIQDEDYSFLSNTGPLPPKVGEETTYLVFLELGNGTSEVENVELKMKLPGNVSFKEKFSSTIGNISYDNISRTVSWKIEKLTQFEGMQGSPKKVQAYMQLGLVPSYFDAGKTMQITNEWSLTYKDTFTGETIERRFTGKDTSLPDDILARTQNKGGIVEEADEELEINTQGLELKQGQNQVIQNKIA